MFSGKERGQGWMSREDVTKLLGSLGFHEVNDTVMRRICRGWTVTVSASCIHNYNYITLSLPDGHSFNYESSYITFYRLEENMPRKIMDLINFLINHMEYGISQENENYSIKSHNFFDN